MRKGEAQGATLPWRALARFAACLFLVAAAEGCDRSSSSSEDGEQTDKTQSEGDEGAPSGGEDEGSEGEFQTVFDFEGTEINAVEVTTEDAVLLGIDTDGPRIHDQEYEGGILRLTDGGDAVDHLLEGYDVLDLDAATVDGTERIYAAAGDETDDEDGVETVIVSEDDGETWEALAEGADLNSVDKIAADADGYIYTPRDVSENGGDDWAEHNLLDQQGVVGRVRALEVGPDGTVYLATDASIGSDETGAYIYVSGDRGKNWEHVSVHDADEGWDVLGLGFAEDESVLLAAEKSIFRSEDSGGSWEMVHEAEAEVDGAPIRGRIFCFATGPSGSLAAGHDLGAIVSEDHGKSFTARLHGFTGEHCAVDSKGTLHAAGGAPGSKYGNIAFP